MTDKPMTPKGVAWEIQGIYDVSLADRQLVDATALISDYGSQCTGDAWKRALRHAAKAACARCRGGQEVTKNQIGTWTHDPGLTWTCGAHAVWNLFEQGDPDLVDPE